MSVIRIGDILTIKKPCNSLIPGRSPKSKSTKTSPFQCTGYQRMKIQIVHTNLGKMHRTITLTLDRKFRTFTCLVLEVFPEHGSSYSCECNEKIVGDKFLMKEKELTSRVIEKHEHGTIEYKNNPMNLMGGDMSKSIMYLLAIAGLGVGGYFVYNKYFKKTTISSGVQNQILNASNAAYTLQV